MTGKLFWIWTFMCSCHCHGKLLVWKPNNTRKERVTYSQPNRELHWFSPRRGDEGVREHQNQKGAGGGACDIKPSRDAREKASQTYETDQEKNRARKGNGLEKGTKVVFERGAGQASRSSAR